MIIAKRKNVEFPSKIAIENCLKYNKKMNAVINKDGLNYIFRNINNVLCFLMHISTLSQREK